MNQRPIFVTQPYLPPLEELIPYLEQIWERKTLTNNGPFHQQFEEALAEYLGVKYLSLFANGTIALLVALQALRITGEVITTPYSFVATTHALNWNELKPVFVDIDPQTCNLDAEKIEAAITAKTSAILPVHCYGNPCAVKRIEEIATVYGLKVIYDAAHAFGVCYHDESLLKHGDLSVLSFHATKVFNTFEGGAIVCHDAKTKQRIDYLKNFGFADEVTVMASGINGKMSEFNAALGLVQLQYINKVLQHRRQLASKYRQALSGIKGIKLLPEVADTVGNAAYFPILVTDEYPISRDELYQQMKNDNIHVRRYFYPLISDMPMYRDLAQAAMAQLPNATAVAQQVLCMPIYDGLEDDDFNRVIQLVASTQGRA